MAVYSIESQMLEVRWSSSDSSTTSFKIQWTPVAGDVGYFLRVSAAYIDGHGPITTGCTQDRLAYCPSRPVTRAQMAAFLHRALKPATNANPN